jgi:ABC-type transporter Mla MlaB component
MHVGLFSIFKGRKSEAPDDLSPDAFPDSRLLRGESTRMTFETEAERERQRAIARDTARKIDAIEQAMVSDIFNDEPAWGSEPARKGARAQAELATTQLLADEELPMPVEAASAPVIDEIAIMYANGETAIAEHMLRDSLGDDRAVWWMLFDLYQVTGQQDAFDSVAIDYASRFETSPPAWTPLAALEGPGKAATGVAPTESLAGTLDASVAPQLERLRQAAPASPALRLEFFRLQSFTPEGCALLLATLQALRAQRRELTLAGAPELADLLRGAVDVGNREVSPQVWLLLLELQLLMNREKEFEETAMDYCITYEVSPPSFETATHVATAAPARTAPPSDRYLLPATITGQPHELFDALDVYASQYDPAVLDCSRLARIDYIAATTLINRLRPLAAGRGMEMRDVNHLVAALFKLLGAAEVAKIFPHKY